MTDSRCPYCGAEPHGTTRPFLYWSCGTPEEGEKINQTETCRIRELGQRCEKLETIETNPAVLDEMKRQGFPEYLGQNHVQFIASLGFKAEALEIRRSRQGDHR